MKPILLNAIIIFGLGLIMLVNAYKLDAQRMENADLKQQFRLQVDLNKKLNDQITELEMVMITQCKCNPPKI